MFPPASGEDDPKASTALANESSSALEEDEEEEEEEDDGTTYSNVWHLGSVPIGRPKDEAAIQAQMASLNANKEEVSGVFLHFASLLYVLGS